MVNNGPFSVTNTMFVLTAMNKTGEYKSVVHLIVLQLSKILLIMSGGWKVVVELSTTTILWFTHHSCL